MLVSNDLQNHEKCAFGGGNGHSYVPPPATSVVDLLIRVIRAIRG
jgi:hypothetical protein